MLNTGERGERQAALADFLRTRRTRLTPPSVGLPIGKRRRTTGLRREEVAQLAGMSAAYYTWLEQGRDVQVSREVLASLAEALRLSPDERRHLFLLADLPLPPSAATIHEQVSPAHQRVLDNFILNPAYIIGRRSDILAWNRAAVAVFGDYGKAPLRERNTLWRLFVGTTHHRYVDWETIAYQALAQFRADSGRYIGDPWFEELIDELRHASPQFHDWWPRHEVLGRLSGQKELAHPVAGRLILEHSSFQVADNPDQKLIVYTPVLDADMTAKLHRLLENSTKPPVSPDLPPDNAMFDGPRSR